MGIVFADLGKKALRNWRTWLYVGFSAFVALVCLARPLSDDFDRYIYEALVRGKHESVERIYPLIKHESPRAEASSVLDSAEHLAQLEPLYAIRPLYIEIISIVNLWLPIQRSINLVSAFSLFGMALVLAIWTKKPLYCALLVTTAAIVDIGRMGTPDALSALFVIAGFWLLERNQIGHGILLLLASVWVRTDNLLVVFAALVWLTLTRKTLPSYAILLAAVSGASVAFINHMAGNYGWLILLRYSFIGGKYPAQIVPHLSVREYVLAVLHGAVPMIPQVAPWMLLGLVAWRSRSTDRALLLTIASAAAAHFALFPSPEGRYFVWAYLLVGAAFIRAVTRESKLPSYPGRQVETLRVRKAFLRAQG